MRATNLSLPGIVAVSTLVLSFFIFAPHIIVDEDVDGVHDFELNSDMLGRVVTAPDHNPLYNDYASLPAGIPLSSYTDHLSDDEVPRHLMKAFEDPDYSLELLRPHLPQITFKAIKDTRCKTFVPPPPTQTFPRNRVYGLQPPALNTIRSKRYIEGHYTKYPNPAPRENLCPVNVRGLSVVTDALYLGRSSFALINPLDSYVRASFHHYTIGLSFHHVYMNETTKCVSSPTLEGDVLQAIIDGGVERVLPSAVIIPNFSNHEENIAHFWLEGWQYGLVGMHAGGIFRSHGGIGNTIASIHGFPDPLRSIGWTASGARHGMEHVIRDADGVLWNSSIPRGQYLPLKDPVRRGIYGPAMVLPKTSGRSLYGRKSTDNIPVGDTDVMPGTVAIFSQYVHPNYRNALDMVAAVSSYFDTTMPFADVDPFTSRPLNESFNESTFPPEAGVGPAAWPSCGAGCVWRPPPLSIRDGLPQISSPVLGSIGKVRHFLFDHTRLPPFNMTVHAHPVVATEPPVMARVVALGKLLETAKGRAEAVAAGFAAARAFRDSWRVCAYTGPPLTPPETPKAGEFVRHLHYIPIDPPIPKRVPEPYHLVTRIRGVDHENSTRIQPWYVDGCSGGGAATVAHPDALPPGYVDPAPHAPVPPTRRRTLIPYDVDDLLPLTLVKHLTIPYGSLLRLSNGRWYYICTAPSDIEYEKDSYKPVQTPLQARTAAAQQGNHSTGAPQGASPSPDNAAVAASAEASPPHPLVDAAADTRAYRDAQSVDGRREGLTSAQRTDDGGGAIGMDDPRVDALDKHAGVSGGVVGTTESADSAAARRASTASLVPNPPGVPSYVAWQSAQHYNPSFRPEYLLPDVESVSLNGLTDAISHLTFRRIPPRPQPSPFVMYPEDFDPPSAAVGDASHATPEPGTSTTPIPTTAGVGAPPSDEGPDGPAGWPVGSAEAGTSEGTGGAPANGEAARPSEAASSTESSRRSEVPATGAAADSTSATGDTAADAGNAAGITTKDSSDESAAAANTVSAATSGGSTGASSTNPGRTGGLEPVLWRLKLPRRCARHPRDPDAKWVVVTRKKPKYTGPACWSRRALTGETEIRTALNRASANGLLPPLTIGDLGHNPLRKIADILDQTDVIFGIIGAFDTHHMYLPRGALRMSVFGPFDWQQRMGVDIFHKLLAGRRYNHFLARLPSCHSRDFYCNVSIPSGMFVSMLRSVYTGIADPSKGYRIKDDGYVSYDQDTCPGARNATLLRTFPTLEPGGFINGSAFGFTRWTLQEHSTHSFAPGDWPKAWKKIPVFKHEIPPLFCQSEYAQFLKEQPKLWPSDGVVRFDEVFVE